MSKENEVFTDDLVKRLREDQPATQDMGSTMQCALQDAAAQRIEELEAKLERAECLLVDAMVQLENGKIKTRRNRAYLIGQFLAELKGQDDEYTNRHR
jgi:hypothetical protein